MNFSQRVGLEPAERPIQKDSMDQALRNGLWNTLDIAILQMMRVQWGLGAPYVWSRNSPLFMSLWTEFFKVPLSQLPDRVTQAEATVHNWYFDSGTPWNKIYEFVEFIGNLGGDLEQEAEMFRTACNYTLKKEASAYRFVGKVISPITNEAEIEAIEQAAANDSNSLSPWSTHIETALKLLSDRNNPDYRNSMKESISAVEALCKVLAKKDKATLGPALDALAAKVKLHPKLGDGFKALYGYTSDEHGIRHALKDDGQPEEEDARFFLVICSAFVNYLTEKGRKVVLVP